MRKIITIQKKVGEFAENKDIARELRVKKIMPLLSKGNEVVIDFYGVKGATQSFIHVLVSDPIREFKEIALNNLIYKNTNDEIKEIISIVYRYMQESLDNNVEVG